MKKLSILLVSVFVLFLLVNTSSVFALTLSEQCNPGDPNVVGNHGCNPGLNCQANPGSTTIGTCQSGGAINIAAPNVGFKTIGNFISNALFLVFAIGALMVLIMLIVGSFEWITSGGDKEAVGKARSRIINALIGLVVLAVAFALANVLAQFTGLSLGNLTIPAPNPNAVGF